MAFNFNTQEMLDDNLIGKLGKKKLWLNAERREMFLIISLPCRSVSLLWVQNGDAWR